MLEEIETFIQKPVDELRVGRKAYRRTVEIMKKTDAEPEALFDSLETLVQEQGLYEDRRPKRRKRKS